MKALLPLFVVVTACSSGRREASTEPPSNPEPAAVADVPLEDELRAPEPFGVLPLVVAGEEGVFELAVDGTVQRLIGSITGASAPRFVRDGRSIVVLQAASRLVEIDLATGHSETVSGPWVPSTTCAGESEVEVSLMSDDDLTVDQNGRHVCIQLLDANENMASHALSVYADLETKAVQLQWPADCGGSDKNAHPFECTPMDASSSAGGSFSDSTFVFDETGRVRTVPSSNAADTTKGWTHVASSPNRRWVVLRGNEMDGDYFHWNLLIADRRMRAVFAVPPDDVDPAGWPEPLAAQDLADPSRERLGARAGDFVTESTVRFFGDDRLVVGHLLILFEAQRVVRLQGELAHW